MNKIKVVLPGVISNNQSAFMQGRSMMDNVFITFEMIHHMRLKNKGGGAGSFSRH